MKIPDILTLEEQIALLEQPNPRYYTGQRNHAILRLLLDSGLRVAEVTSLKWHDFDLLTGKMQVKQGKKGRDRTLWVGERTLETLQKWRKRQANEAYRAPSYVFTTIEGGHLSPRYVQQMVKRYRERAGIDKQVTPHTLRHTFATEILRETENIRLVQKALGHSCLSTIQIYTHMVDEEMETALKNFRKTA